jgi:two-component system sensor histidine kinase DesK
MPRQGPDRLRAQVEPGARERNPFKLWPLLWLVFIAYPIGDLIDGRVAGPTVLAAAGLVAFVALYVAIVWLEYRDPGARQRLRLALLGGMTALAFTLGITQGGNWVGVLIYLSAACAMSLPLRWTPVAVVVVSLAMLGLCRADGIETTNTLFFVFVTAAVGVMVVASQRVFVLVAELHRAREEVARLAVGQERLRFARDLHDLLGHSLSLIVVKSQLARRLLDRDVEAVAREVRDIEAVAQRSLVEVREAVSGYRRQGLAVELDSARAALEAAGIDAVVRTGAGPLPGAADALLGWAVREGVTNVLRHSKARRCEIAVLGDRDRATLEVRDDGPAGAGGDGDGNGLRGLAERVRAAGGHLDAGPRPGGGFGLTVSVPLEVRP